MSVREQIAKLEAKTRDAKIEQQARALKATQMFVDERQAKLYPLANTLQTPTTYESLHFEDMNSYPSNDDIEDIFEYNLRVLSGNNMEFVYDVERNILKYHNYQSIHFLNQSWKDFSESLKKQFRTAKISTEAFIRFTKKYMKDLEPIYLTSDDNDLASQTNNNSQSEIYSNNFEQSSVNIMPPIQEEDNISEISDEMERPINAPATVTDNTSVKSGSSKGSNSTGVSDKWKNVMASADNGSVKSGGSKGSNKADEVEQSNSKYQYPDPMTLNQSGITFEGFAKPGYTFDIVDGTVLEKRTNIQQGANQSKYVKALINMTRPEPQALTSGTSDYVRTLPAEELDRLQNYIKKSIPVPDSNFTPYTEVGDRARVDKEGITFKGFPDRFTFQVTPGATLVDKRISINQAVTDSEFVKALVNSSRQEPLDAPGILTYLKTLDRNELDKLESFIFHNLPEDSRAGKPVQFAVKANDSRYNQQEGKNPGGENIFNLTSGNGIMKKQQKAVPNKKKGITRGRGAQANVKDKYYVDMAHLNNNKFALKYRSTGKVIIKPTSITDKQKNVILNILLNKFNQKEYDALSDKEEALISKFCVVANVNCVPKLTKEVEDLGTKLKVLIGEMEAGNDSPDIRRMLIECTQKLMDKKGITKLEGLTLLNQLK